MALAGASDLAEIATICSVESAVTVAAVVDPRAKLLFILNVPVVPSFDAVDGEVDAVIVTDLENTQATIQAAERRFGADRVLVPSLLKAGPGKGASR